MLRPFGGWRRCLVRGWSRANQFCCLYRHQCMAPSSSHSSHFVSSVSSVSSVDVLRARASLFIDTDRYTMDSTRARTNKNCDQRGMNEGNEAGVERRTGTTKAKET